ncbi:MAG TPA: 30S ribosomal protein S1 [Clostridiales bacterium]|nr:30S ribosomal protein S1 [Clostridiales bacterium]
MSDVKEEILEKDAAEVAAEIQQSEPANIDQDDAAAETVDEGIISGSAQREQNTVTDEQETTASGNEEESVVNDEETKTEAEPQTEEVEETEENKPLEEETNEIIKSETMEDFSIVSLRPGQIVQGKILRVTDEELIVNVGYKSDGVVAKEDIMLEEEQPLTEAFHEGDKIEVEVIKVNDGEGNVVLSQKNIVKHQAWKVIEDAFQSGEEICGIGKEVVKGGILANIKGFSAFVPASQLSLRYVADLSVFVGQKLRLQILEVDKRRNRVVASQRAVLEAEEAERRQKVWDNIEEGQKISGEVKRLTNFGAFVDIGGVDGLIHISDLSWGHIKSPKQVVSEGQQVEVLVLSVDKENNRISLGYKQTLPHPWDNIEEKYPVGQIFQGKVVRITNFGAFVELEPGVDGLVHISQISDNRVDKVEDVLQTGEQVSVKILDVKPDDKRISLSIREAVEKKEKKPQEQEIPYTNEEMTVSLGEFFPEQNE